MIWKWKGFVRIYIYTREAKKKERKKVGGALRGDICIYIQ